MKKLFAATGVVVALLSGAGAATAGTYQGIASHDGTSWEITWSNVFPVCSGVHKYLPPGAGIGTIDGVETVMSINSTFSNETTGTNSILFHPSPAGVLSKLTFQGKDSFQCDGHTFLLPGYVAPAPIPTLSEWAMILLGVVLAGGAALTIQRRRAA